MTENNRLLQRIQLAVYLLEVSVLSWVLTLAAVGSPGLALGPIARVLAAVALPLPCHLLLIAHAVWTSRARLPRLGTPDLALRPPALPAPVPTVCG